MVTEAAQEALEKLWIDTIEGAADAVDVAGLASDSTVKRLEKDNLVERDDGRVRLTSLGHEEARKVIRRHRLAERLLHDVLAVHGDDMEDSACKFEHILSEGVAQSICTLLGHPTECPHGRPIPRGKCCQEGKSTAASIVSSLARLKKGQKGDIVYLLTKNHPNLQKLLAMGVLPGQRVEIIQTYPSYVFQIGQTQVAVDREIADNIFVRHM